MRLGNFLVRACLSAVLTLGLSSPARAQFYAQHNLVSDGAVPADHVDPDLVNPWGLAASATSPSRARDARQKILSTSRGTLRDIKGRGPWLVSGTARARGLMSQALLEID